MMLCGKPLSPGLCTMPLTGGPRRWYCPAGHEWWGEAGGALRSSPWPNDYVVVWPKPGPVTRRLRWRWWARLRAHTGGWFWLPCPLCGQMFGGQEDGGLAVYDNPRTPATGMVVCPAHDPVWPEQVRR